MESLLHSGGRFLSKVLSPLFSFLPRGDKNYLSLDIGSSSIKMLEVRGSGSAMRILNAGIAPLPPNAVQGNVVQDSGSVTQAIRALLERQRVKTTEVVAAVPGPAVIIKRATFRVQEPQDVEEIILFAVCHIISQSLD